MVAQSFLLETLSACEVFRTPHSWPSLASSRALFLDFCLPHLRALAVPREPRRPLDSHCPGGFIPSPGFHRDQMMNCLMLPHANLQAGLFPDLRTRVSSHCSVFNGHPVGTPSVAPPRADSRSASSSLRAQSPSSFHCLGHSVWYPPWVHNAPQSIGEFCKEPSKYIQNDYFSPPWPCPLVQATSLHKDDCGDLLSALSVRVTL